MNDFQAWANGAPALSAIPWQAATGEQCNLAMVLGERAAIMLQLKIAELRLRDPARQYADPDGLLIAMDLAAVAITQPERLELRALARLPDDLFLVDVLTVQRSINRTTGRLPDGVRLRCAIPRI